MRLILIAGKARSGKTNAAFFLKEILEEHQRKTVITEFSKYIKLFAKELIGWNGEEPKPRKFLQDFGSMVRHESNNPYYFIERMKEDIAIYQNLVDVLIISDVRFPEEIVGLKEYHPISILIRNDFNAYDLDETEASHETEHAFDSDFAFDYKIENENLIVMKEKLNEILEKEHFIEVEK